MIETALRYRRPIGYQAGGRWTSSSRGSRHLWYGSAIAAFCTAAGLNAYQAMFSTPL